MRFVLVTMKYNKEYKQPVNIKRHRKNDPGVKVCIFAQNMNWIVYPAYFSCVIKTNEKYNYDICME